MLRIEGEKGGCGGGWGERGWGGGGGGGGELHVCNCSRLPLPLGRESGTETTIVSSLLHSTKDGIRLF